MNFVTLKHPYKSVNLRRRKYQRALNLVRRNVWCRSLEDAGRNAIEFTETLRVLGAMYGQYRYALLTNAVRASAFLVTGRVLGFRRRN